MLKLFILALLVNSGVARVVQEVPFEEYYMNYKQVEDCDNPLVDGTCPLLGGPYRLPNLWLPMNGTVFTENDYKVQSALGYVPPPRAFHGAAAFQDLLWITGGRTTPRDGHNTRLTDRLGDVWYSEDGDLWTQVVRLLGDFSVQETDAIVPGPLAPWWARYGHTLTPFDIDFDGKDDIMVLMGGFAPEPMNDVWYTSSDTSHCKPTIKLEAKLSRSKMAGDGSCEQIWKFAHYAPWAPRGWHTATVFLGRLFVLGGSPLNNEVWSSNITNTSDIVFEWKQHLPVNSSNFTEASTAVTRSGLIWSPRSGHVAMAQHANRETLYVMGGFGGWPCERYQHDYAQRSGCHRLYDGGSRSRNDVWKTTDGHYWTRLTSHAAWGARSWSAGVVWHQLGNVSVDVSRYGQNNGKPPKMWLAGGVYYGTKYKAFAEVYTSATRGIDSRVAYTDLWWSYDGITWTESSLSSGNFRNQDEFSTSESYATSLEDKAVYLGKYGHSLTAFKRITENLDEKACLFMIAGDRVPQTIDTSLSEPKPATYAIDVFRTALGSDSSGGRTGMMCNTGATECSGHGTCCHGFTSGDSISFQVSCTDEDFGGCVCGSGHSGEFCEIASTTSDGVHGRGTINPFISFVIPVIWFTVSMLTT
jgi:hypothetical protein